MINTAKEAKELLTDELEYQEIESFEGMAEGDFDDILHGLADGLVDVYTSNLWKWASENYRYVEDAIREFGMPKDDNGTPDLTRAIMTGQYLKAKELLRSGLEELIEEEVIEDD